MNIVIKKKIMLVVLNTLAIEEQKDVYIKYTQKHFI